MKIHLLIISASLLLQLTCTGQDTTWLFYLGGQSNMDGYGYNNELPENLDKTFPDVWIFHGNQVPDDCVNGGLGIWSRLQPGHGAGFSSDGKENRYSDRFGLELSFAERLAETWPGQKIALIKYSRGGTAIDTLAPSFGSWDPDYRGKTGLNQYDHFLATVRNALDTEDIDGDGREDILVPRGIIWMQGESDGEGDEATALRYYEHLKRLMDLMRAVFRTDDLPVAIGKISDSGLAIGGKVWNCGELIQYAQEKYVQSDAATAIVRNTAKYDYSDPWHYDSKGYIDLGRAFADAIAEMDQP